MATGRPQLAEPHLRTLAKGSDAAKLELADYLAAMRRPAEAMPILEALAAGRSRSAEAATIRIASARFADNRRDEARVLVDQLLANRANNTEARLLRGRILAAEGKIAEGVSQVREAIPSDPQSAEAQVVLASLLVQQNEPDQAAAAFREALRLNPRHRQAGLELSRLELAAGRTATSVSLAEQAVRIDPDSVEGQLTLARGLMAHGDLARAEPIMERLVKAFPKSATVLSQMGELKLRRGDAESASRDFTDASAIEPNSAQAVGGLVAIDLAQRRPKDGIARAQQLVSRNPKDVQALLLMARTYIAAGSPAQAESALRRALVADDSQLEVYAMLGRLFTSQGGLTTRERNSRGWPGVNRVPSRRIRWSRLSWRPRAAPTRLVSATS